MEARTSQSLSGRPAAKATARPAPIAWGSASNVLFLLCTQMLVNCQHPAISSMVFLHAAAPPV
jgi:hypothetical protein